ncbi:Oligopeptide-binding protein AppA precursor [Vibrio mediterranei]|uniref:ABC transporter substrate-binding protein n=1 Tax=Vibrio mediterranei TaxID=689 RepID=UPI000784F063|nr:ABC transporter substrate-binding protein [Vibrio mediterranei]PTC05429.1 ABC transporter substrate-binding protein [Vibrio mediterranei]SBO07935.1 Oligopeptide-binding protein AppA precursor [Vibrio mediterranei]
MKKVGIAALALLFSVSTPTFAQSDKAPNLKILSEGTTGWVKNFNPWVGGRDVTDLMYEPLYVFNKLDSSQDFPWLATGYELSDDLASLTVVLREGVKWSDGENFSADDVIFTYQYMQKHPEIDLSGMGKKVTKVEKLGEHKIKLHLAKPNAFAQFDVIDQSFLIVPKHIWENIDQPAQYTNVNPVGTGPFTEIERFNPQVYIVCQNNHYWNDKLAVPCVEFPQFSTNDNGLELMTKGETDWNSLFIPDVERMFVDKAEGNKYWFPSYDGVRITLNYQTQNEGAREAFDNLDFRKAFNLAMDREAMIDIGVYGYVTGNNPASGLPPFLWEWRNEKADNIWAEYYQYDLKQAQQYLDLGGFKDVTGDGFRETPSGKPLNFIVQVPSGWSDWINNASIAVEGLRDIGINANVTTPETNLYVSNWESNNFDACFCGNSIQSSIWKFYEHTTHSRYANTANWWSTGMTNHINLEIDKLIDELAVTVDKSAQKVIVDQIEMYYAQYLVHIPLYYNSTWFSYNDSRYVGWFSEQNPVALPVPWSRLNRIVQVMHLKPRAR